MASQNPQLIAKMESQTALSTNDLQVQIQACEGCIAAKGEIVRNLKKQKDKTNLDVALADLLAEKKRMAMLKTQLQNTQPLYVRNKVLCENLLKRRFFLTPSFEIYGGMAGFFDLGPPGSALKAEVEAMWRKHFLINENIMEVSTTCLTPYKVLKASGHVDRFTDLMVRDVVTTDCYRADKYLQDIIQQYFDNQNNPLLQKLGLENKETLQKLFDQADALSQDELQDIFIKWEIKSPVGNELTKPFPFNLMFKTHAGPSVDKLQADSHNDHTSSLCFLRPETAQGIFVNFKRLLEFNGGRFPFGVAQLGTGFRNEISPRNGLLRVREFPMAEIEYFHHPDYTQHPQFNEVKGFKLPLYTREHQLTDGVVLRNTTLEEAKENGIIKNETLAYFLARTFQFLTLCGIPKEALRFRQHLQSEMAHYASDCWDADIHTSSGWIEVVGHADRSAYDLQSHSKEAKIDLVGNQLLDKPQLVRYVKFTPNKPLLGRTFQQNASIILNTIELLSDDEKKNIENELVSKGMYVLNAVSKTSEKQSFNITREMIKFEEAEKTVSELAFTPAVIEPSFGIGRLLQCIFEHTFQSRDIDGQELRCYFSFPASIAPFKCSILPLSPNKAFNSIINDIHLACNRLGLSSRIDTSGVSIGKRYARTDELGIPFAITIDFQTLDDSCVTLRDRDSMTQIRVPIDTVPRLIKDLVSTTCKWTELNQLYKIVGDSQQ